MLVWFLSLPVELKWFVPVCCLECSCDPKGLRFCCSASFYFGYCLKLCSISFPKFCKQVDCSGCRPFYFTAGLSFGVGILSNHLKFVLKILETCFWTVNLLYVFRHDPTSLQLSVKLESNFTGKLLVWFINFTSNFRSVFIHESFKVLSR